MTDGTLLRQALVRDFGIEELRTLCYDLGVDYDDLPGEGKEAKARELVASLERRGETDSLIAACSWRRPNSFWVSQTTTGATNRLLMTTVGRMEVRMNHMEGDIARLKTISTATLTAVIMLIGGGTIVALLML